MICKFYDYDNEEWHSKPFSRTDLDSFTLWWLETRTFRPPLENSIDVNGKLHAVVLFREGPWQVQLISVAPNSLIVEHRHPNVDTYEIFFSGNHVLVMNGKQLYTIEDYDKLEAMSFEEYYKIPYGFGLATRIAPKDWHRVEFGSKGGSFLSIQKWLYGVEPTSVGYDWLDSTDRAEGDEKAIDQA